MTWTPKGAIAFVFHALLIVSPLGHAAAADTAKQSQSNIVKLTKFNFDENVQHGAWFVKFYAPWCAHCQRLAPLWEKLADHAAANSWPVKVAEVDCTTSKEVCETAQVKAFPTLALIREDTVTGRYQGEATMPAFEAWLQQQGVLEAADKRKDADQQGPAAATATARAGAALADLVTRFPTANKIVNIYVYGGVALALLVAVLCVIIRLVDSEEPEDAYHEKDY
mmetsp:Transcript_86958/g.246527  ORF Transcript_86958/g.246527 Transcript_86958/m.246527 type:complete len:224 (-) Transcript_86958:61-732(-)